MPNLPKPRRRRYLPDRKRTPTGDRKFLNSRSWRRLSVSYRQSNPLCEVCEAEGIVREAAVVDHIISRSDGGSKYSLSNLMGLCSFHHDRKSAFEGKGLTLSFKRSLNGLIPEDRREAIGLLTGGYEGPIWSEK